MDVGFVAGRAKPIVVGVIGAENAGKTTLLAAWYLLLGRGARPTADMRLAGSYSFLGWEAVSNALRWGRGGIPPSFPPHTATGIGRAPGLLHLAFRSERGDLRDFLFADAPGDWFQRWAVNRDAPNAEGARWVSENADVFLLIADNEALSGPSLGTARGQMQLLAARLGAERMQRPVALVWSKSDAKISAGVERAVRQAVRKSMQDAREFKISVFANGDSGESGKDFLELLGWTVRVTRQPMALPSEPRPTSDPFFAFGRS